jgi:hypothetical protein
LYRGAILFVVLLAMALGVRAWVASRLNAVEKVEQTLRSVVELELKSIDSGDTELFRTVQDAADSIWQERQINRYFSGRAAQFAPAPGLSAAERSWDIKQVQVLGGTARVDLARWFQEPAFFPTEEHPEPNSSQPAEPHSFGTTWFYRVDQDGNWYHIPPPDEYLGVPHSWHGTRLDIQATEIEAASIDPAASDLAILVSQVCLWLDCPEDVRYSLSFEDALTPQVQGTRWALPALYLTGLPETADGRAAWQRALEMWVLGALAQSQVKDNASRGDAQDSTQRIIYDQLVARIGAELGIGEPVSPDVDVLAKAVRNHRQHSLEELWDAETDPTNPEESRLLEAEIGALLDLITSRRGDRQLFLLLPALRDHPRLSAALPAVFGLDIENFTVAWHAYLSDLTGATALVSQRTPEGGDTVLPDLPLPPPPIPAPPQLPPGDHIAFICAGQIWASNADGSELVPLTSSEERFKYLHWSPDGAWIALDGPDEVVIVDKEGHERYALKPIGDESCSHVTWNPAADLRQLRESTVVELLPK